MNPPRPELLFCLLACCPTTVSSIPAYTYAYAYACLSVVLTLPLHAKNTENGELLIRPVTQFDDARYVRFFMQSCRSRVTNRALSYTFDVCHASLSPPTSFPLKFYMKGPRGTHNSSRGDKRLQSSGAIPQATGRLYFPSPSRHGCCAALGGVARNIRVLRGVLLQVCSSAAYISHLCRALFADAR